MPRIKDQTGWDKNKTYTFTVAWGAGTISIFLDGETLLAPRPFRGRTKDVKYLSIGDDNYPAISGAIPGPVYKSVRVYREKGKESTKR